MKNQNIVVWLFVIWLQLLFISCSDHKSPRPMSHDAIQEVYAKLDTEMYAILPIDSINNIIAPHLPVKILISTQDILVIDSILQIAMHDTSGAIAKDKVGHTELQALHKYRKQYLPVQRGNDTLIWVNCFCESSNFPKWRKEIVVTKDGGNCHFQVLIDLTTLTYSSLIVNGEA